MPYNVSLPDGRIVEGIPDDVSQEDARKRILESFPDIAAKEKRGWGEALTDIGASALKGVGTLAQLPGQIGQLAGIVAPTETDTGLQGIGKQIEKYGEEAKSPILRGKETIRGQKIEQADGMLSEFGTAFKETIKDPALLTSFFAEQLPNLAGSWGGGLLARGATKALMASATEQALGKAGVRGAIGTGAIQQGADVGSDTYETIYKRLTKEGMDDDQANGIALSKARIAALEAAGLSIGTAYLPGGATIERALAGKGLPTTGGIAKGLLGEAASESVEEGGGKFASNVGVQEVFPETSLTKGVGAAAGMGALGGALFGGIAGGVNAGRESAQQELVTIQQQKVEAVDQARRDAFDLEQKQIQMRAMMEEAPDRFMQSQAYADLSSEVEAIKTKAAESQAKADAALAAEDAAKAKLSAFSYVEPNKKGLMPKNVSPITEAEFKEMGIGSTNKSLREKILGKNLSNPKEAQEVKTILEDYLQEGRSKSVTDKVSAFLDRAEFTAPIPEPKVRTKKQKVAEEVPSEEEQAIYQQELEAELAGQQTPEAQNVRQPVEPIDGANEPSVRVPSERPAVTPGIEQTERRGVVPPVDVAGQLIRAEAQRQRALKAPPAAVQPNQQILAEPATTLKGRQLKEYKEAAGNYLEKAKYIGQRALETLAGDLYAGQNAVDAKRFYRGLSEAQKNYVQKYTDATFNKWDRRGTAYNEARTKQQEAARALQEELGQEQEDGPLVQREITGATNEKLIDAVQRGDLAAALNAIAKDTSNTFNILEKLVSNRLLANKGSLPRIEVVAPGVIKGGDAQYNPFTDTVQITEGQVDSHTVLHETVHGFLHALIEKFEKEGAKNKGISDLKNLYDFIKEKHPELSDRYAMQSLTEFASELMSNREFQQDLAQIPYRTESQSLFGAFIRAVLNALGLSPTSKLSALASGLFAADRSIAMGRKIQEDVVTGKETLPIAKAARDTLEAMYQATGPQTTQPSPGPFQTIKDTVGSKEATKTGISRFLNTAETMLFSSDAALNNAIRKGLESSGASWDTVKNMMLEVSTSQATHADAVAMQFLQQGSIKYDPKLHKWEAKPVKDSWANLIQKDLVGIANKYDITLEQANKYANQAFVAKRLDGLSKSDKQIYSHMTPEQIKAGLAFFQAIPELNALQESWNKVRQNVMDAAVEGGLYNKEQAKDLLKIIDYVPFYRIEQLAQHAGPKEYGRGLIDFAKNYKIKGSEQAVADIFDNMERWASYTISRAVKNRSAISLYDTAKKFFPDEVKDLRQDETTHREQNTIDLWVDGNRRRVEFKDPLFVHAFQGIESAAIPHFGMAASAANLLRKNIVLMPLFSISQLSQDSFGAMLTSGLKHPWALPVEVAKEFIKTLRGTSKAAKELTPYGAVGVRDYSATFVRDTAEIMAGLKKETKSGAFMRALETFAMASDNAVRQAIYNMTLKETGDKAAAIEKAFEIINFKRSGASGNIQMLRQVIPFFGAYLQAQNVIYKTLTGKGISPVQKREAHRILASNALKIGALAFMYAALVSDDEDYQKMDPSIRDRHLLIPGTSVMLPMRSDLTLMPKLIAEYTYLGMTDNGFTDGKKIRRAMSDALANAVLSPTVAPQAIKPALEVMVNYDFFTDRSIIGQGIANKVTAEQYTNNTSELGKLIGSSGMIAPVNVDHLIKGYMGTTGGLGLMFTNAIINSTEDQPKPEKSWRDAVASTPGLSAFVSREYGNADKNDFYELRKDVDKAVTTFNSMKKQGRIEDAKVFLEENKDLIKLEKQISNINKQLTKLRDYEKQIYEFPEAKMTAEKKGEEIRRIREMEKTYLSNVNKLRQMAGY
jgi:hypothetical protein